MSTTPVTPEFTTTAKKPKQFGLLRSGTKGFPVTRVDSARANFMALREASVFAPRELNTDSAIIRQQPVVFSSGMELGRVLDAAQSQAAHPRERSLSSRIFASGSMKLFGLAATVIRGAEDLLIAAVKPQIDDVANATRAVCNMSSGSQRMCKVTVDLGKQALVKSGAVDAAKAVHSACVKGVEIYAERNEALHGVPKEETRQFARDVGKVFLYATPWAIAKEFQYAASAAKTAALAIESSEAVAAPLFEPKSIPDLGGLLPATYKFVSLERKGVSLLYSKAMHPNYNMTVFLDWIEATAGSGTVNKALQIFKQSAVAEGATRLFVQLEPREEWIRKAFAKRLTPVGEELHFHREVALGHPNIDPTYAKALQTERFSTFEMPLPPTGPLLNDASVTLPIHQIDLVIDPKRVSVGQGIKKASVGISKLIPDYTHLDIPETHKWLTSAYRNVSAFKNIRDEALGLMNVQKLEHGGTSFVVKTSWQQQKIVEEHYGLCFLRSLELEHLHLPRPYSIGRDGERYFLVKSYVPGETFDEILTTIGAKAAYSMGRNRLFADFLPACQQLGKALAEFQNRGLDLRFPTRRKVNRDITGNLTDAVNGANDHLSSFAPSLQIHSARLEELIQQYTRKPGVVSYAFGDLHLGQFTWSNSPRPLLGYIDAESIPWLRQPGLPTSYEYAEFITEFGSRIRDLTHGEIARMLASFKAGYFSEYRGIRNPVAESLCDIYSDVRLVRDLTRDLGTEPCQTAFAERLDTARLLVDKINDKLKFGASNIDPRRAKALPTERFSASERTLKQAKAPTTPAVRTIEPATEVKVLRTERLRLEAIQPKHEQDLKRIFQDPYTMRAFDGPVKNDAQLTESVTRWSEAWQKGPFGSFAVYSQDNRFVGYCGLGTPDKAGIAELAYAIVPLERRQWYGTEIAQAIKTYAEELYQKNILLGGAPFHKIEAAILSSNESSQRVAKSIGMKLERLDGGYPVYSLELGPNK